MRPTRRLFFLSVPEAMLSSQRRRDAVERHHDEQRRQINQRREQEPPRRRRSGREGQTDAVPEEDGPEHKRRGEIKRAGYSHERRQQAYREEREAMLDDLAAGAAAVGLDDRQESDAGAAEVVAINIRDRQRVRDLPEK